MKNNIFKVALIQNAVSKNKSETLKIIENCLQKVVQKKVQFAIFGETFNSLYTKHYLRLNAENLSEKSETLDLLKSYAKSNNMYIVGSIPELTNDNKIYNTCLIVNKQGQLQDTHRKMHLFDVCVPNKIKYYESEIFCPGNKITVIDTDFCKIGIGICYDVRFPELGLLMSKKGAKVLIYPGAFNTFTGPLHWELLLRSRALDNQAYSIGVCTARHIEDPKVYQAWGHSICVDPFGKILTQADHQECIQYVNIDLNKVDEVRQMFPLMKQKRYDVYQIAEVKQQEIKEDI